MGIMKHKITERYIFAYVMAIIGGYIGGYSYTIRGGVFASAQTGNLIQLGLKITVGNFSAWYLHIFPIIMFGLGIMLCEYMKMEIGDKKKIHWKQILLIIEALILLGVAFVEAGPLNLYANMLLGLAAGMQTQMIRMVEGTVMMTTMLSGNARTMTELLYHAIREKNITKYKTVVKQFGVMLSFITGVITAGFVSHRIGYPAIAVAIVFIIAAQVLIFVNRDNI